MRDRQTGRCVWKGPGHPNACCHATVGGPERVRTEPRGLAGAVPQNKGDKRIWRPERGYTGTATCAGLAVEAEAAVHYGD